MEPRGKRPQGRSLASLFPCCFKGNDTPEITHCHDNANSVVSLEPSLPMPPPQELDAIFTELVVSQGWDHDPGRCCSSGSNLVWVLSQDELDLSEEHRADMFSLPAEKKWLIYCSKKKVRSSRESHSEVLKTPPPENNPVICLYHHFRRRMRSKEQPAGHSIILTSSGVCLLWVCINEAHTHTHTHSNTLTYNFF